MSEQPPEPRNSEEANQYSAAEIAAAAALLYLVYEAGQSSGGVEEAVAVSVEAIESAFRAALLPNYLALAALMTPTGSPRYIVEDAIRDAARIAREHIRPASRPLRDDMYEEARRIAEGGSDVRETTTERAARIAVTSSLGAMRDRIARETGMTRKRWNTQRDARVRRDHIYLEGMRIPINKPFYTQPNRWRLMFPGDMTAPYGAWVGCRCFLTYTR